MPIRHTPCENQYAEPNMPPSVTKGVRGGIEQTADQERVLDTTPGVQPGNEDTAGSVDTRVSPWDDHD